MSTVRIFITFLKKRVQVILDGVGISLYYKRVFYHQPCHKIIEDKLLLLVAISDQRRARVCNLQQVMNWGDLSNGDQLVSFTFLLWHFSCTVNSIIETSIKSTWNWLCKSFYAAEGWKLIVAVKWWIYRFSWTSTTHPSHPCAHPKFTYAHAHHTVGLLRRNLHSCRPACIL